MKTPTWYALLLKCRNLPAPITAAALADVAGHLLEPEQPQLRRSRASVYLAHFVGWGYLKRAGTVAGAVRWERAYDLTAWGRERGAPKGTRRAPV